MENNDWKVGDIIFMNRVGFFIIEDIKPQFVTKENKSWWYNKDKNIGDQTSPHYTLQQIARKGGRKYTPKRKMEYYYGALNVKTAKQAIEESLRIYDHILDRIK